MLQTRLAAQHELHLRKARYGFPRQSWHGCSFAHPAKSYCMEYSEMTNTPLHLPFLGSQKYSRRWNAWPSTMGMSLRPDHNRTSRATQANRCQYRSFEDGTPVPTTTQNEVLRFRDSMDKALRNIAFQHTAALAETGYKKLRLVWNSSLPRKTKFCAYSQACLSLRPSTV